MKLSEDLQYWRAERPDEWKMDDFIRIAKNLQDENVRLKKLLAEVVEAKAVLSETPLDFIEEKQILKQHGMAWIRPTQK